MSQANRLSVGSIQSHAFGRPPLFTVHAVCISSSSTMEPNIALFAAMRAIMRPTICSNWCLTASWNCVAWSGFPCSMKPC